MPGSRLRNGRRCGSQDCELYRGRGRPISSKRRGWRAAIEVEDAGVRERNAKDGEFVRAIFVHGAGVHDERRAAVPTEVEAVIDGEGAARLIAEFARDGDAAFLDDSEVAVVVNRATERDAAGGEGANVRIGGEDRSASAAHGDTAEIYVAGEGDVRGAGDGAVDEFEVIEGLRDVKGERRGSVRDDAGRREGVVERDAAGTEAEQAIVIEGAFEVVITGSEMNETAALDDRVRGV